MSYKTGYIGRGKEVHYVKEYRRWWWRDWKSLCGRAGEVELTDKLATCKICLKHRSVRVVTQSNIEHDMIPVCTLT